jgi:lipoprotein-anchoring transpeptidase ErfK/SrfK
VASSAVWLVALVPVTEPSRSIASPSDGERDSTVRGVSVRLAALPALRVQVLLDRAGFSPGAIDGQWGPNTERALQEFQRSRDLNPTGAANRPTLLATLRALGAPDTPVLARYTLTQDDLDGPFVERIPDRIEDQARLDALHYTSASEALAERFHTLPEVLRKLNPDTDLVVGQVVLVPAVLARRGEGSPDSRSSEAADSEEAARLVVSKSRLALTLENERGKVVFYAPVTAGSTHDPLPLGDWQVVGIARDPVFHYDPDLFWDAEPRDDAAVVAPGPNNPVGSVWIDLDKDHYGIHGTPEPETVGHVQSHGCVRLTNWDAIEVAARVRPGTAVAFRE